jgi:MFS family permease
VSSIGDWLYLVALIVLVYRETQDPVILGIVGAARMIPYLVLSIPAGIITDRVDRRMVLLVSDLARMVCMLVLAALVYLDGPLIVIVVVAMVAACFSTFFYPAMGALLPSLVRDEREFGPANSAWATLDNSAWIVGPGLAGLLLASGEIGLAFLINAGTFVFIAAILWTLPRSTATAATAATPAPSTAAPGPDAPPSEPAAPASGEPAEDTRKVLRWRIPRSIDLRAVAGVVLLDIATWFAFGGVTILIVVIAVDVFQGGDAATGYLNTAVGVGGTIGAVVSGVLVLRPRLRPPLLLGGVIAAGAIVLLGFAPSLGVAFVAIAIISLGALVLDVIRTTILQRVVPDRFRGRFTGLLMTTQTASEAGGTLVLPMLAAVFSIATVFGVLAVIVLAALAASLVLIGSAANVAAGPYDAALRRLARLSIFGGLSAARVEAGLRALEPIHVAAGEAVIRQGEPADRFYVIGEGSFEVSQTDEGGATRILRRLEQDAVFGERGIIARAPRSATVTALTDGLLFAMDGAAFLELVGARSGVAERFMSLYDQPAVEAVGRP